MNEELEFPTHYLDDDSFREHTLVVHEAIRRLTARGIPATTASIKREDKRITDRILLDSIDALVAMRDLERRQLGGRSCWILAERKQETKGWQNIRVPRADRTKPHAESVCYPERI